jgi:ribosome-binding factor A
LKENNPKLYRLANQIKQCVAKSLNTLLRDPRLKLVTITSAKISADLSIASIYYLHSSETDKKNALDGLYAAKTFFRRKIAEDVAIRKIPDLRFFYDESVEHGAHIEALIHDLNSQ